MKTQRRPSMFSHDSEWGALSQIGKATRICRILMGFALSTGLLAISGLMGMALFYGVDTRVEAMRHSLVALGLLLLVGCVARILIFRLVKMVPAHFEPPHPPEPPTEGAPKPAPLRPSSPLILSAKREIPEAD